MPDLTLSIEDLAVISLSLSICERLLFKSRYEPEVQDALVGRIRWLQQYINRRVTYDIDGNNT